MLTPTLLNRLRTEVPTGAGFETDGALEEFTNAAKFLSNDCQVDDDGVINFLHGLYEAVCEEFNA